MDPAVEREKIGGYELVQAIGDGAQGRVYKARKGFGAADAGGGAFVALKIVRGASSPPEAERFRRTAQRLLALSHPHLVRYHGAFIWHPGEWDEAKCFVMECLQGETLDQRLARAPQGMEWEDVQRIFSQCLDGLLCAAEAGITHRDLKPSNIFLVGDGAAKCFDFDIARREDEAEGTVDGWKGTFDYMAPDFALEGGFHGDELSDVFSLGVCLYQALTGRLPFETLGGNARLGYLDRWKDGGVSARVSYNASSFRVLAHARSLIAACLQVDRAKRCPSLRALREGLDRVHYRCIEHPGRDTYELRELLGGGAFGEVFRAVRRSDGRGVAVKHLFAQGQSDRFLKEARILQRYAHPHIVRYIDFIAVKGTGGESQYFLVMELLDDMPAGGLRTRIKTEGRFDVLEATSVMLHYLDALRFLHENSRPIIHRDIKPTNLYAPRGRPDEAKIFDLGVARDVRGTATAGAVPGTLDYMAPEFATAGVDRGTPQSDLYALGLCYYEMLTGHPPFPRLPGDLNEAWMAFQERARNPHVAFDDPRFTEYPELRRILAKCLAPQPRHRYGRAALLLDDLATFRQQCLGDGGADVEEHDDAGTVATVGDEAWPGAAPAPRKAVAPRGLTLGTTPVHEGAAGSAISSGRPRRRVGLAVAAGLVVACLLGAAWWLRDRIGARARPPLVAAPAAAPSPSPVPAEVRPPLPVLSFQEGVPTPGALVALVSARAALQDIGRRFPADAEVPAALQLLADYVRGVPEVVEERVRAQVAAGSLADAEAESVRWQALRDVWGELSGDPTAHAATAARLREYLAAAVFDNALSALRARIPTAPDPVPARIMDMETLARQLADPALVTPDGLSAAEHARRVQAVQQVEQEFAAAAQHLVEALGASALRAVAGGPGDATEISNLRTLDRFAPRLTASCTAAYAAAIARVDEAAAQRLSAERIALEKRVDTAANMRDLLAAAVALEAWRTQPLVPPPEAVRALEARLRARSIAAATGLRERATAAYARLDLAEGDAARNALQSLSAQTAPQHGRAEFDPLLKALVADRAAAVERRAVDADIDKAQTAAELEAAAGVLDVWRSRPQAPPSEWVRDADARLRDGFLRVAASFQSAAEAAYAAADTAAGDSAREALQRLARRVAPAHGRTEIEALCDFVEKAHAKVVPPPAPVVVQAPVASDEAPGRVAPPVGEAGLAAVSLEQETEQAAERAFLVSAGADLTPEQRLELAVAGATGAPLPEWARGQFQGTFAIVVTPADATIRVDGRRIKAPSVEVTAGRNHTVHIERAGYEPFEQTYRVKPGETNVLDILLAPRQRKSFFSP